MFGRLFRKRMSATEMGEALREPYQVWFSADMFHSLFKNADLAPGHTVDFALAEWHAFGAFVFTHCLWIIYSDQHKVFPILDSFRPALLKSLCLNKACEKRLLEIWTDREKDYFEHFQVVRDGPGMVIFFSRVAARITGHFSPDSELAGLPQTAPINESAGLSAYTIEVMVQTKRMIEQFGPK